MHMSNCGISYFVEGMRFDLRELMFHVVGVHRTDLLTSRSPQNFDNLHQLVNPGLSWE